MGVFVLARRRVSLFQIDLLLVVLDDSVIGRGKHGRPYKKDRIEGIGCNPAEMN